MIYYNITLIALVVLFDICCILLSYKSLTSPKLPEWEQEAFAFVFIVCAVGVSYSVWGVIQS